MTRILAGTWMVFALFAILLTGCATTHPTAVWKDPSYHARPGRIMVIGVAREPLNRRLFEDEFVAQLRARGTEAIASYTVLTDKQQDDQAAVAKRVKELGADSLLISRLVDRKTVRVYVPGTVYYPPPYYNNWPDYYGYGYRYLYTPGYVAEDEYAIIETNLYEAASDRLVWAATSETRLKGTNVNLIRAYVGVMVDTMAGHGLLAD
ncbi:MAG TPA: hypothetical protein VGD24_07810 [Gallionella sp.]